MFKPGSKPLGNFKSGGNAERESFNKSVHEMPREGEKKPMAEKGDGETHITHHPDGTHSVKHSDGEESHHPTAGHMSAHLHSKHSGGEVGNMEVHHEGGATTHHVGMDGAVEGPQEHGSAGEGAEHLASMLGDGGMEPPSGPPEGGMSDESDGSSLAD